MLIEEVFMITWSLIHNGIAIESIFFQGNVVLTLLTRRFVAKCGNIPKIQVNKNTEIKCKSSWKEFINSCQAD